MCADRKTCFWDRLMCRLGLHYWKWELKPCIERVPLEYEGMYPSERRLICNIGTCEKCGFVKIEKT